LLAPFHVYEKYLVFEEALEINHKIRQRYL